MTPDGWLAIMASVGLIAIVELDGVQVGQMMVSRPLAVGPLLGWFLGIPQTGLLLGVCGELLSIDDLPVGNKLPLNVTVAVGAAVLLCGGPWPAGPELALPLGLGLGWLHQRLETALRQRRRAFCCRAEERLRNGQEPGIGAMQLAALAQQAAVTLAVMAGCVFLVAPAAGVIGARLPESVLDGLQFAWRLAPWLGMGVLLYALRVTP